MIISPIHPLHCDWLRRLQHFCPNMMRPHVASCKTCNCWNSWKWYHTIMDICIISGVYRYTYIYNLNAYMKIDRSLSITIKLQPWKLFIPLEENPYLHLSYQFLGPKNPESCRLVAIRTLRSNSRRWGEVHISQWRGPRLVTRNHTPMDTWTDVARPLHLLLSQEESTYIHCWNLKHPETSQLFFQMVASVGFDESNVYI